MADITYSKPTWVNGSTVPISAANLQDISDAVDAVAHKANRGEAILDSDTVSGHGIEPTGYTRTMPSNDFDSVITPGMFNVASSSLIHNPTGFGSYEGFLHVYVWPNNFITQEVIGGNAAYASYYRSKYGVGAWSKWFIRWDSDSTGNGDQPPAPKPIAVSANEIGEKGMVSFATGADAVLPAGGVWSYLGFGTGVTGLVTVVFGASGVAGGTTVQAGIAGTTLWLDKWRTS